MDEIQLDEGVAVTPPRKSRSLHDPRSAQLLAMDIDTGRNSFYLEGETKKGVRSLVALGKRINVFLIAREFPAGTDEINPKAGVRVWRVSEGKLPRRKAKEEDF